MDSTVYRNIVVTVCSLGLLGLLAGCLGMSISFESANPDKSTVQSTDNTPVQKTTNPSVTPENTISHQVENSSSEKPPASFLATRINSIDNANSSGSLRMSNRTEQPVRLALLARHSSGKNAENHYDVPAHWDFAPEEGSDKGLILSLPEGNLKLEKGDILVAFAQDGSRTYWGPYVVGETSSPTWNPQHKEWDLVLSP